MSVKIMESKKTVREIARVFPEVCADHQFGVLGIIDIRQKLQEKGLAFDRECLVFEVCNPRAAKQVLDVNPAISTALPCRISVYEDNGKTRLATILPTVMLALFPNPELKTAAEEVEQTILQIMADLA